MKQKGSHGSQRHLHVHIITLCETGIYTEDSSFLTKKASNTPKKQPERRTTNILRKSTHHRHEQSTSSNSNTSLDAASSPQRLITRLTQEILRKKLNQTSKKQQSTADRIRNPNHEKPRGAGWIVKIMHEQPDGLADGGSGAVGKTHQPWFRGHGREEVRDERRDARAQSEALEGLVEGDCDEEHDERCPCCDADGHPDEDAVEEDPGFEEETLQ